MPDFNIKPSFPIATVIDAAGRNAQLQEQAREAGNKSLIEGLQSIGQVGESLYAKKQGIAQALAIKKALMPELPDEVARTMSPDQMLHAAGILHKTADVNQLMEMMRNRLTTPGATSPATAPASPAASATPAPSAPIQPGASLPIDHSADLASTSPTIPMPAPATTPPAMPFGGASTAPLASPPPVPVPIAAPPVNTRVNPATIALGKSMGLFNPDVRVMSTQEAQDAKSVPKGTIIRDVPRTNSTDQVSWATATPQQQSLAQAMYEGRVRPSDIGFRDRGKVTLLANEYANQNGLPPFKSYNADVNATMAKYATSGKLGQNALSLNTALGHAASAYDSYQAIGNTNEKWLNTPINVLKKQTNDPNVVALGINLNALQGELANVFKNSGATDQEISHWQKYLNEDLTPAQFNGALSKIDDLLKSRLSAMEYQRNQAGGGNGSPLLSPDAKEKSKKLSKGQGGQKNASVTPKGTSYTVNP